MCFHTAAFRERSRDSHVRVFSSCFNPSYRVAIERRPSRRRRCTWISSRLSDSVMKKTLLALAMAAAAPSLAYSQTNIVLNGSIDQSLEYFDSGVDGVDSDIRVTNGVWAGSRFAISGTEDLGSGLKGISTSSIASRPTPAPSRRAPPSGPARPGRSPGGFGTVRLGRQYTPVRRALEPGDTTGFSWYNNADGLGGITTRFDNDVSYQSPHLGGFTMHAAYAAGESSATPIDNELGDAFGIAGVGDFGPATSALATTTSAPGMRPVWTTRPSSRSRSAQSSATSASGSRARRGKSTTSSARPTSPAAALPWGPG